MTGKQRGKEGQVRRVVTIDGEQYANSEAAVTLGTVWSRRQSSHGRRVFLQLYAINKIFEMGD